MYNFAKKVFGLVIQDIVPIILVIQEEIVPNSHAYSHIEILPWATSPYLSFFLDKVYNMHVYFSELIWINFKYKINAKC